MSSNLNTLNLYSSVQFDEYAVRKLLCAVIEMAVIDYKLCVEKELIVDDKLNRCSTLNYDLPKTIENLSEIKSLITFFHEGGLEKLIESACLKDEQGQYLSASYIRKSLCLLTTN